MNSRENGWAASLSRRGFLKGGAVVGAIAAGSGASLLAPTTSRADTAKVVVQYDWLMGNGQIGDVVAVHNGYFKDQGLEVEMIPGGPNSATLAPIVSRPGPARPVFRRFAAAAGPLGRRPGASVRHRISTGGPSPLFLPAEGSGA